MPISGSEVCSAIQECIDLVHDQIGCEATHAVGVIKSVVIHMAGYEGSGDMYDPAKVETYPAPLDARIAQICGEHMFEKFGDRQRFNEVRRLWDWKNAA